MAKLLAAAVAALGALAGLIAVAGAASFSNPALGAAAPPQTAQRSLPGCEGPLSRTSNVIGHYLKNGVRSIGVLETSVWDCDGAARTNRVFYVRAPGSPPPDIAPTPAPSCRLVKTGINWAYDRNNLGNLLTSQAAQGARYFFRIQWPSDTCGDSATHGPSHGNILAETYCGGGLESQQIETLRRAVDASSRVLYEIRLTHRLSGAADDCPETLTNTLWTDDVPEQDPPG